MCSCWSRAINGMRGLRCYMCCEVEVGVGSLVFCGEAYRLLWCIWELFALQEEIAVCNVKAIFF